jgi:Na+-driven multidrug efflux pump
MDNKRLCNTFRRDFMQIEVICVLVLPILFGPYGIWYAVIAAEIFALVLSIFFLIRNRKKYGYI